MLLACGRPDALEVFVTSLNGENALTKSHVPRHWETKQVHRTLFEHAPLALDATYTPTHAPTDATCLVRVSARAELRGGEVGACNF